MLKAGDAVCLEGELGAGKTVFAKGVAESMGLAESDMTSASFTIVAEYNTNPPLYHIDLYRLSGADDAEAAGVFEFIGGDGIALIEWADRLGPVHTASGRIINVDIGFIEGEPESRIITIKGVEI